MFSDIYRNKTVFITGHTGFKGTWLAFWLQKLGAKVIGFSLDIPTEPSHFKLLGLDLVNIQGDIRNFQLLKDSLSLHQPEIVFHLAAQSLVRYSYQNPVETFETNIMGTVNLFEAIKNIESVKAVINVTSDKAYENKEWVYGYRETDPMGGFDPYSASKGCAELVTSAYRRSFYENSGLLLASVRAGNVIGGGDWALDRLLPDVFKATSRNESVYIRNPNATRPWQHVLEPLSGYLQIGQKLLERDNKFSEGWNFGPTDFDHISVKKVLVEAKKYWKDINFEVNSSPNQPHEAHLLKLDVSKARMVLNWKPVWNFDVTIEKTTNWYKDFYLNNKIQTEQDWQMYINDASVQQLDWTK